MLGYSKNDYFENLLSSRCGTSFQHVYFLNESKWIIMYGICSVLFFMYIILWGVWLKHPMSISNTTIVNTIYTNHIALHYITLHHTTLNHTTLHFLHTHTTTLHAHTVSALGYNFYIHFLKLTYNLHKHTIKNIRTFWKKSKKKELQNFY